MDISNYPSYLRLYSSGKLKKRVSTVLTLLENCSICPWQCGINRLQDEKGQCQTGRLARVYSYSPHFGEERPISGKHGSGTIFFSGCNMHCVFCQNADISQGMYGMEVTVERLAEMMLELQERGCHNVNLVTPSHVIPQILEALLIAIKNGFHLPFVYNTGGYDAIQSIRLLEDIIDIYMPDMKYSDAKVSKNFSGVSNYPSYNQQAILEMYRQVSDLMINTDGIALSGLLVRHLILPNGLAGTEQIMNFIANRLSINTYINLMDQYRPEHYAHRYKEINRRVSIKEFETAVELAVNTGLKRIDHLIY